MLYEEIDSDLEKQIPDGKLKHGKGQRVIDGLDLCVGISEMSAIKKVKSNSEKVWIGELLYLWTIYRDITSFYGKG